MTSTKSPCSVCLEPFQPHTEAVCNFCGESYHLNHRQDIDGKDCGQVWINEEHMALEFACNTCLAPPEPEGALDDILTLDEAATLTGQAEEALRAAADGGGLRHRKTAGGVYLFERRDLASFSGTR